MLKISQWETRIHFPPLPDLSEHSFGISGLYVARISWNLEWYQLCMYLISIRVGNDWRARLVGAIICNNNGCRSFIKSQTKTVLQQTTNWKIVTNYVARKCDNDGWVNKKMTSWLGCHCPGHLISGQMFIFQGLWLVNCRQICNLIGINCKNAQSYDQGCHLFSLIPKSAFPSIY